MTSHSLDLPQQHTCQCCLASSQNNNFKDLTTEYHYSGKSEKYIEMIYNVFSITINTRDDNNSICEDCVQKLKDAADFKQLVVDSQRILLKRADELLCNDIKVVDVKCEVDLDLSTVNDTNITDYNSDEVQVGIKTEQSCGVLKKKKNVILKPKRELRRAPSNTLETNQDISRIIKDKWSRERHLKVNTAKLIGNSNICPFKWHRNKYQCFCCKETFINFDDLRKHASKHTWSEVKNIITRHNSVLYHKVETSDLKCRICSQTQANLQTLRDHLKRSHNIPFENEGDLLIPFNFGNGYRCAVCQEDFQLFYKLNIHMNCHFQNFICEACGAGFANQSNLREHSLKHSVKRNEESTVKKRVCPYCGERFKNHYSRLMHTINVHGEKKPEFKCNTCDRVFFRQYLLNSHVRKMHIRERPHECDVCTYKCFNRSDLTNHMATHTGVKGYVCTVCGKSYSRKGSLNWHSRTHSDG